MDAIMRGISRRRFLQGVSGSAGALGLLACEIGPTPYLPPPVETETAAPVPTRPPEAEAVEVELIIGSFPEKRLAGFEESLRRFHSHHPGIRIRLDFGRRGESLQNRLAVRLASGEGIDVAQTPGPHLNFNWMFSRLSDFAKADSSFSVEPYYSRMVDYYNTPDDGLWCLPWSYATEALYYNIRHFAEADVAAPNVNWTWDDVRDTAGKLTKRAGNNGVTESWGVEFRLKNLDYVLRSYGGGYSIGHVENPEVVRTGNVAALQFVADLVLKDRVHSYPALGLDVGFAQGKVSMAFLPEWATARLNTIDELDYDVAPIPQGPAGSVTSFSAIGVAMGRYDCYHPDHAWEVIKWFAHADFGEWDVARALLFPDGMPTALIAANGYCWSTQFDRPENRHLFLHNFESAVVPFSDSPWWPHLSDPSLYSSQGYHWSLMRNLLVGGASVEEVLMRLDKNWVSGREQIERILSENSKGWSCF